MSVAHIISGGPSINDPSIAPIMSCLRETCPRCDIVIAVNAGRKYQHDWAVSLDWEAIQRTEGIEQPAVGYISMSEGAEKRHDKSKRFIAYNPSLAGGMGWAWAMEPNYSIQVAMLYAPWLAKERGETLDTLHVWGADHAIHHDAIGNIVPHSAEHTEERWTKELSQVARSVHLLEKQMVRVIRHPLGAPAYPWVLDWAQLPALVM